jgi:hypothetical protein
MELDVLELHTEVLATADLLFLRLDPLHEDAIT